MAAKQYFEHGDKFWETWVEGANLYTRHGKVGATGQTKIKAAKSPADAKALQATAIAAKQRDGFAAPAVAPPVAPVPDAIPEGALRLQRGGKFWQVQRREGTVTITEGKLGTSGPPKVSKHHDAYQARAHVDALLTEKKRQGYTHVVVDAVPSPVATNPALEKAIVADPDSDDGFTVYADHLQQHGDVRGDLAVLDVKPGNKKAQKLLWERRAHFFGPLAAYRDAKKNAAVDATWRHGWMERLSLSATDEHDVDGSTPTVQELAELVRVLPQVASARFLRELVLRKAVANSSKYKFGDAVKALVKSAPSLPLLRALTIGQFGRDDAELSWTDAGDLSGLWKAFPQLESLLVHAGAMRLGAIDAPRLRSLRIETGGLSKASLASVLAAKAPRLETLNLWFGAPDYGFDCQLADMVKLLDARRFPKLVHLGLANTVYGDELAPHIAASPLLRRLETLDLSRSHLTTQGVRALATRPDALAHLQRLDLSMCLLDRAGKALAKTLCKHVELGGQDDFRDHEPDDEEDARGIWWRYTAIGE